MNDLITGVAWLLSGCVFKCYSRSESAESSKRIPLLPPHVIMICHTAAWTRTGKLDALCLELLLIWNHVSVPKCHLVFEWNPAIYKVSRISFWCWSAVCRDAVKRCLVNINKSFYLVLFCSVSLFLKLKLGFLPCDMHFMLFIQPQKLLRRAISKVWSLCGTIITQTALYVQLQ